MQGGGGGEGGFWIRNGDGIDVFREKKEGKRLSLSLSLSLSLTLTLTLTLNLTPPQHPNTLRP